MYTTEKMNNLIIGKATDMMTELDFVDATQQLLEKGNHINKSVWLRSHKDLEAYYTYSIVALLDGTYVANTTCHPATMVPSYIDLDEKTITMGESSSVIVDPAHQWKGIGKKIFAEMQKEIVLLQFDAVIGGTISPSMKHIWHTHQYKQIHFPGQLYEEWKAFFANLVGEEYFERL